MLLNILGIINLFLNQIKLIKFLNQWVKQIKKYLIMIWHRLTGTYG